MMQDNTKIVYKIPYALLVACILFGVINFTTTVTIHKLFKIGFIEDNVAVVFFALLYPLFDSITEVYGKKVAIIVFFSGNFIEVIINFLVSKAMYLPSPPLAHHGMESVLTNQVFHTLFQQGFFLSLMAFVGVSISMLVNVLIISKLKYKMRGRHFMLRSIISSVIGEVFVTLAIYPVLYHYKPSSGLLYLMLNSYFYKVSFSIVASPLAKFMVFLFRMIDQYDAPTYNIDLAKNTTVQAV